MEQKSSESDSEMARRDAQIKTLTSRADQLAVERKKVDGDLKTAREEARASTAKLAAAQQDLEQSQASMDEMRTRLEAEIKQAQDEAAELRGMTDDLRTQNSQLQGDLETAQSDVAAARATVNTQKQQFDQEIGGLRKRLGELEDQAHRHEDRVSKLYARIKGDEKMRDKTKGALHRAAALGRAASRDRRRGDGEVSAA